MEDTSGSQTPEISGSGQPTAEALSLEALRRCLGGKVVEGAALYRQALGAPGGWTLPVRRHVQLLAGTGLSEAAALIWHAGLRAGADLSSGLIARNGDPREAVSEYEDLFARGVTNARMMADYLVGLSRIGASDKLAAATDPAALFRQTTLPVDGPVEPFLDRVATALLGAKTREFQPNTRSIRNMERVWDTHKIDDPDIVALHTAVRELVTAYIADVAASRHMLAAWLRADFRLHSWGVITEDAGYAGYSAPHIHTGCWVVAVAYIAGEDPRDAGDGIAGTLRIGPAAEGDATCAGWPDLTVAPIPGTVVIMPAYYTHWTVPLRRPGLRISVAFNADEAVQPADLTGDPGAPARYLAPDFTSRDNRR